MTELEYIQALCENIKQLRLSLNIKQVDLAYSIGIEPTNLRRIEAGKTCPTFKTLCRIASALNVDVKDLIPLGAPIY